MSSPDAHNPLPAGIQLMAARNGDSRATAYHVINILDLSEPSEPSRRFLETDNRELYLEICVPLNKYALKGNWEAAERILRDSTLLTSCITRGGDTVLHVAAGARQVHFVAKLVERMKEQDLTLKNDIGNTAFSIAAAAGSIEIAGIMMNKNPCLPTIRGGQGMTPLYMAALLGHSVMADHLYSRTKEMLDEADRLALFFTCIDNSLYDLAMKMLSSDKTLAKARNAKYETALHILARLPSEFTSQSPGMWSRLINSCWKLSHNRNLNQVDEALQLVQCLWTEILNSDHNDMMALIEHPSKLVFDATKLGNYEFLAVLINSYPDLIWELDDNNRSIIHVAVLHRHESIFNLVHEIGSIKDIIVTFNDNSGSNNILHMAAKLAPRNQLNLVSGAALQMQRELVWFEEVKKIVPPPSLEMKNTKGKTPRELFTSEHKGLLHKGEAWMKHTANSCMIVAALIATVVFSAAFSLPGGTSENTGEPKFLKETAFLFFAISDGVALVSSSTSILMFLFILTSRYTEGDFLKSLPLKLMIGLTSLFISIASMMVAFSTTFYLDCHYGLGWVPNLIFVFAFVPVALFAFLQFPLLSDMFSSTYCSSLLFQPWKHMID
ncbi:ankyrin repeat-containing protein At5g02620-like isoform X2 [Argentina anserina]|uniref:ankyrin repeat-containing protein At5g02620-like isoform X2 n=1 Tax=Argentina anserina TaxID=57926 RepID=UPI0021763E2F|nr:ankyrin repeat-containing protein At5g02620-like isoform X2 [Potentilla anserina]